jgi:TRAP-type C4-dicarboxylate transport system permease small subunit
VEAGMMAAVFSALEKLVMTILGLMVVLVFTNVVLRYGFNSGITLSDELSRFMFVWLIFIGAFLTMRDNAHLGVNGAVKSLPARAKVAVKIFGDVLTLVCCVFLAYGTSIHILDNMNNFSPVGGIPLGLVYLSCLISCVGIAMLLVHSIWQVATGRIPGEALFLSETDELV